MTALLLALALQDAAPRVAELAPELEAKETARIYRAVERLAELGPSAAPLLEARAKDAPAAAKPYLLLAAAEARRAAELPDGARLRRYTVTYAPQDLGVLLNDFQRRTGSRLIPEIGNGAELPDVGVALADATFLEGLLAIARAAKMVPRRDAEAFYLDASPVEPPTFSYGGALLRLETFTQRKLIDFRRPARNRIDLGYDVLWDPALKVVSASRLSIHEASDGLGRKLAEIPPEDGETESFEGDGFGSLELESAGGAIDRIAVLRGELPLRLQKRAVTIALGKPTEGGIVKAHGFEVRIVKVDPKEARVEIEIRSAERKPEELRKLPMSATGQDPAGQPLRASVGPGAELPRFQLVFGVEPRGPGGFVVPNGLAAEKVELMVTLESVERRIPFEFRDLKLR